MHSVSCICEKDTPTLMHRLTDTGMHSMNNIHDKKYKVKVPLGVSQVHHNKQT